MNQKTPCPKFILVGCFFFFLQKSIKIITMKNILFLAILLLVSCKSKEKTLFFNLKELQKHEKNEDYSLSVKELISQLNSKDDVTHKVIRLNKGTYHFHPEKAFEKELYISNHDQDNPKKVAFFFENLKNITIDGKGSKLVFHGTMIPFVFKNCENITLKNFSIDFELPQLRQLEVLEVDKQNGAIVVEIHPKGNYTIENNRLFLLGDGYKLSPSWVMAFDNNKRLSYRRADVDFNTEKVTELKPNILKINGWSQNSLTKIGERFALRTYNRPTPGIVIDYCKNSFIENVTVHYAWGMGLLAQMSENITLNGFHVALNETDSRYFTTQADATHFSACKGIIKSENGLYEGMADDAINVHGTYLKIIERINDRTVKAQYMHPQAWGFLWGEVGDEVQFVRSNTMELVAPKTYNIQSIVAVDKPSEFGAKTFQISFSESIPDEIDATRPYGIENLTWTPEVIFKNNIIRNNRARGALFSTPKKVICEDNVFDHTHGTAILLCGDCNGWYETGACKEVIIRNNIFKNALTANYQFTNAVISIYPEIPNLNEQKQYFHSGIVIENNIFETFDEPILYAKSVDGLIFKNNKVLKNTDFTPFHWNNHPFFFEKVKNVHIIDNQFDTEISHKHIKLNLSDEKEIFLK